ncbi:MAG: UDP-N-acetylmuramoyl-tripeptide--D-alanyl-D-alanine ligase [Selenomonadaceae bacterium]|nr:UDP-N-acetylmuramoyl-tripeptide--D-alanyl-D-alanine ligase [Selenomonadaceae bacterium]
MAKFTLDDIVSSVKGKVLEKVKTEFSDIVTDTRKLAEGVLFVALKGERFNGETFAKEAIEKGAAGVLVSSDYEYAESLGGTVIQAEGDTQTAYQQIAAFWRRKFAIPVITITGSNGKTTTKDLIASVLGAKFNVLKTQANFNNEIGLPLTLLNMQESHDVAVVEIGMRGLGQIAALVPVAGPNIGIVTNVGETHMELLGSMENIAKAKGELVEAIPSGGTVILNNDNPYVAKMAEKCQPDVKVVTFGIEENADIKASDIENLGRETKFKCTLSKNGEAKEFVLPMAGRHNVYNSLAAIAAGVVLGLSYEEIAKGLGQLEMSKMRFEYKQVGEYTVINDAYNASPMSMEAALNTIGEVATGRTVAVLGDMLELGENEVELHRNVGRKVPSSGISFLIAYGKLGKHIAEGAREKGMTEVLEALSHEEAAELLHKNLKSGDTILFKASRGMKLEKIIDLL